jgi:hypothetical protein
MANSEAAAQKQARQGGKSTTSTSREELIEVVKKIVKRSYMEHFQSFYHLVEPNLEADAHIWAVLMDIRELLDPSQFENTVRQAYREFRGRLKLGWGAEVDEMIQKIFVLGTEQQREAAGFAIARMGEDGVGPNPEGEKRLREINLSINSESLLPPEIQARLVSVSAGENPIKKYNFFNFNL